MPVLLRCIEAHFQGDEFVSAGATFPEGDRHVKAADIVANYFQAVVYDDPEPKKPAARKKTT